MKQHLLLKRCLAVGCLLSLSRCDPRGDCGALALKTQADVDRASACTSAESVSIVDTAFERVALPALRAVRLDFQVLHNDSLVSLSFPALEQVNGLSLANEKVLTSFTLPALTSGSLLAIEFNAALTEVSFPALTTVVTSPSTFPGAIHVDANPSLTRLDLPALATLDGNWELSGGNGLTEVGLPSLTTVSGPMYVMSSAALTALRLPALRSVWQLVIEENPVLTTVELPALVTVSHELDLMDNPALPSCAVAQVVARLSPPPQQVSITGNDDAGVCTP